MRRQRLGRQITVWLFTGLVSTSAAGPALADMPIVPDAQAPASQQPLVQEAANGVPLVQITAPTAGGVSRNRCGLQRPRTRRRPQQLVHADANAACRVRAR